MHEMSIMASLFGIIQQQAAAAGAQRVLSVKVRVGALAGVEPELLSSAFDIFAEGTVAKGACFEVERVPITGRCRECGKTGFQIANFELICPDCCSKRVEIVGGEELVLEKLEVEIADKADPGL